jgi:hypothetical protein
MFKSWWTTVKDHSDRRTLITLLTAALLIFIYFWNLDSRALSANEASAVNSAPSFSQLANHAVNLPHQAAVSLLKHFDHASTSAVRAVSAVYGLIFVYCFYAILRFWFGSFSAWLGTLFLAATPFMILLGRSATADVMYLLPLTLIAAYMKWLRSKNRVFLRLLLISFLGALTLYQPGGLPILVICVALAYPRLRQYLAQMSKKQLLGAGGLFIVCSVPFILTIVKSPVTAKELCLIPSHLPAVMTVLKDIGWSILSFFWHSADHHDLQVGRLAVLNAAQDILLAFGLYAMWDRARRKVYGLIAIFLGAAIASGLNNRYGLLVLGLPALSLVVTAGLRYLHLEWTTVFPRNPLPRGLAITLMIALILIHIAWGAHYSLTAWPHSLTTG